MKLRFTATARTELNDLLAFIAQDNSSAAAAVGSAVKTSLARLRLFPRLGSETDDPSIFIQVVRPFGYLIFYTLRSDTIIIRNVRHPARQRPEQ
jgi:plasmid stabilization system protein ParE